MKLKHKVIKDFHYLKEDKKIVILQANSFLEEYIYTSKDETFEVDKEIVANNPEFFQEVDWRNELLLFMKKNKIPQPAVLSKKIIPFIDEMFFSTTEDVSSSSIDDEALRELENKEYDLNRRESRIADAEEDIQLRLSRIQKREEDYKQDLKSLDSKEDALREKIKSITDKELELKAFAQELNEKERNIESQVLSSSEDLDSRYKDLQGKIDSDLKDLTERENAVEEKEKQLKKLEDSLVDREEEVNDKIRDYDIKYDSLKDWAIELEKLNGEIQDWENLHWKFQRNTKPPSAI
jgi:TolA-binding protein